MGDEETPGDGLDQAERPGERTAAFDRRWFPVIAIAALASIPGVVVADPPLGLKVFDTCLWFVFVVEAAARARLMGRAYLRNKGALFDLVIVVLTVPVGIVPQLASLRLLRLARVIRLGGLAIRLVHQTGRVFGRHHLGWALAMVVAVTSASAVAVHIIEPGTFPSIGDGMWWAVVTLFTAGYGDLAPQSIGARIVGGVLMASGFAILAMLAASLSSLFVEVEIEKEDDEIMDELARLRAVVERIEGRLDSGETTRERD